MTRISLYDITYNYRVFMADGLIANCSALFTPIDSSGYHVKIYCRNTLIGDCVHPDRPSMQSAIKYCIRFLNTPIKYDNDTILDDEK